MNLLKETVAALAANHLTTNNVRWVGSLDGTLAIGWHDFAKIADQVNYDDGFGSQHIATDLVIVGGSWWLERHEYDGSECWAFKSLPIREPTHESFDFVGDNTIMCETLADAIRKRRET